MERPAFPAERGVSLIELMIALLFLMIVSLALMQSALLGITMNVRNALRDEAVNVADRRMNELRGLPFTDASLAATASTGIEEPGITRSFRGANVTFTPTRTISNITADSKQITLVVAWSYKNVSYSHGITSIFAGKQ